MSTGEPLQIDGTRLHITEEAFATKRCDPYMMLRREGKMEHADIIPYFSNARMDGTRRLDAFSKTQLLKFRREVPCTATVFQLRNDFCLVCMKVDSTCYPEGGVMFLNLLLFLTLNTHRVWPLDFSCSSLLISRKGTIM